MSFGGDNSMCSQEDRDKAEDKGEATSKKQMGAIVVHTKLGPAMLFASLWPCL